MSYIKKNDTYPYIAFSFTDDNEQPVDCTPFIVKIVVRNRTGRTIIDAIIGKEGSGGVWMNETEGIGKYEWKPTDTEVSGQYEYEFKFIRKSDNKRFTIPENGYYTYEIKESIRELEIPEEE